MTTVAILPEPTDRFFTATQRQRLQALMEAWRTARDTGGSLPAEDRAELEALIDVELQSTALRTAALLQEPKG